MASREAPDQELVEEGKKIKQARKDRLVDKALCYTSEKMKKNTPKDITKDMMWVMIHGLVKHKEQVEAQLDESIMRSLESADEPFRMEYERMKKEIEDLKTKLRQYSTDEELKRDMRENKELLDQLNEQIMLQNEEIDALVDRMNTQGQHIKDLGVNIEILESASSQIQDEADRDLGNISTEVVIEKDDSHEEQREWYKRTLQGYIAKLKHTTEMNCKAVCQYN